MDRQQAHKLIDELFDLAEQTKAQPDVQEAEIVEEAKPERKLPEGKRVVRTKQSGDRVYLLDEVKKTRQWVTNPEVLKGIGFEMSDVVEVADAELLRYQLGAALYRVPDADTQN